MKHKLIAVVIAGIFAVASCNNSANGDSKTDTTLNRDADSVPLPGVTHDGLRDTSMNGLDKTMSRDSNDQ